MAGLASLCLAYILSQFYRSFLAVLTPALTTELGATNGDLSLASGMWFLTFALMQFGVGVGLDRFGPRRTAGLLLGLAGGGGVFLFAFAQTPLMIVVAMGLIGIGCSPVLMASLFIFARTFSAARFALLTSAFIGIGNLGNIFGASPMAAAVDAFGWRFVVGVIGVLTLIVALAIYFLVKDPPKEDSDANAGLSGYLELFKIRNLWFIFPIMLVIYAGAAGIRGLWAGPFLADVYGADALLIGQVTLFMAFAMAIGSFVYGPLDTLFNTRKWVVVPGAALAISALAYMAMNPMVGTIAITVALIIIGLTGVSYGVLMAHGKAFFPKHLIGRGVTLMNFFSIGGVALMQLLTGVVAERAADVAKPEAQYQALFWFYAAAIGLALFIYLFSKDAKPKTA